jgi:integrase
MAFIRKRVTPKGKVCYTVVFTDSRGQRRERSAGSTKKAAENLRVRIERELAEGTFEQEEEEDPLLAELCESFLRDKKSQIKASTYADYERSIKNHIMPFFKKARLSEISPMKIQGFLSYLEEQGVSNPTRGKILRYLKSILRYAVTMELLNRDPCHAIRAPKVEHKEMDYLNPEEVRRLLESTDGEIRALLAMACLTGLRQGELLALQWKDIDFKSNTVRVTKTYRYEYGFTSPKTASSRRVVPMPHTLVSIIKAYHASSGSPGPDEIVFPNRAGKPIDRANLVRRDFVRALEGAKIRSIRFHDLRHTFASLAIEGGVDLKTLQSVMGHSTIRVTLDHYGHLYTTALDRLAAGVEAVITQGPKVVPLQAGKNPR